MADLRILQVEEKVSYDVFAVIAKALLIFMLVYGALGGFLSAYEIEYNKSLCMLAVFLLAMLFGAVYETGKRWAMNLLNIFIFFLYLYIALRSFWIINSGCYAILNHVMADARDYLHILNGTEYILAVEDEYATVTGFALFIGLVGTILFNIQMQQKASLVKVLLMTLPFYIFPFYFEKTPEPIYTMFLFTGYLTVAVLQNGNVCGKIARQMRYVLPVSVMVVVVIVRLTYFFMPQQRYAVMVPVNAYKKATETKMDEFIQYGMLAFFMQGQRGAGISGGVLGNGGSPIPDYETDLVVRFTPYSYQTVYLKAFTGKDYMGNRWTAAGEELPEDGRMESGVLGRARAWTDQSDEKYARGIMEVKNVGASAFYEYRPYYTDYESVQDNDYGKRYVYYPAVSQVEIAPEPVDGSYLLVPDSCRRAVQKVCGEAYFSGTPEEIARQVEDYFQENYHYSLRPGYSFGSNDYITHFLLESKRGYCAHFATAGTMLFRYMGIPARYVEGYIFTYADIMDVGELVEDADYNDYYSGYSPIGETGLVEVEIPDANAHAWVEIYIDGKGWVVVDPTPVSTGEEEEEASFWDVFMNMNRKEDEDNAGLDFGQGGGVGEYLEKGIGGLATALVAGVVLVVFLVSVRWLIRRKREAGLSGRQRVQLAYRRLTELLSRRNKEFSALRTVREQVFWVEQTYGVEIPGKLTNSLYVAFFSAGTPDVDMDEICKEVEKLHRMIRFKRGKRSSIDKKVREG